MSEKYFYSKTGVYNFPYFWSKTYDCGYSLEPHWRGDSNVYPQPMFLTKNISKVSFFPQRFLFFKSLYIAWARKVPVIDGIHNPQLSGELSGDRFKFTIFPFKSISPFIFKVSCVHLHDVFRISCNFYDVFHTRGLIGKDQCPGSASALSIFSQLSVKPNSTLL